MTTPHEAVAKALDRILFADPLTQVDAETRQALVTAAIEALREGADERLAKALRNPLWSPDDLINAILGPPNEVPE